MAKVQRSLSADSSAQRVPRCDLANDNENENEDGKDPNSIENGGGLVFRPAHID